MIRGPALIQYPEPGTDVFEFGHESTRILRRNRHERQLADENETDVPVNTGDRWYFLILSVLVRGTPRPAHAVEGSFAM